MNTFNEWCDNTAQIKQENFWNIILGGIWKNKINESLLSHDIVLGGVNIDIESLHIDTPHLCHESNKYLSIPLRKIITNRKSKSRFFIKYDHRCDYGFAADLNKIRENIYLNNSNLYQLRKTDNNKQRLSTIKNSGEHVRNTYKSNTFYRVLREDIKDYKFLCHGDHNVIKNFIEYNLYCYPKLSILRYPGGKFYHSDKIINKFSKKKRLIEACCGGATVAIRYAQRCDGDIWLNDSNPAIASFWNIICGNNKNYDLLINSLPDKMDLNKYYLIKELKPKSILTMAMKFFILNKCSVMGITTDTCNPIGGKEQKSKWSVDWCWKLDKLINKMNKIRKLLYGRSKITCKSVFDLQWENDDMVFIDPPYVKQGPGLYGKYGTFDHKKLAEKIIWSNDAHTVLTYDDVPLIYNLYSGISDIVHMHVNSQKTKQKNKELLISLHFDN